MLKTNSKEVNEKIKNIIIDCYESSDEYYGFEGRKMATGYNNICKDILDAFMTEKKNDCLWKSNRISKQDLLLRGPGDILGTRQSGISGFILGNIYTDTKIIEQAKKDAVYILNSQDNKYDKMKQLIAIKNANGQFFID